MKKVLVIGAGGREHAIARKLQESPQVDHVIVAPGNDAFGFERWPVDLSFEGFQDLAVRVKQGGVDLVVVGPDNPLADGIVDVLESRGVAVFGPTASAARVESSKAFAKGIMQEAHVPTADYRAFDREVDALEFLDDCEFTERGWVVKADGLALGKGVQVCRSRKEAQAAIQRLMKLSGELVIEQELVGEEVSCIAFCDGTTASLFPVARDYKRLLDGQQGPNTGGMGVFAPVPGFDSQFQHRVLREVFEPVLKELQRRGSPFKGFLYAGLMVHENSFWVLEFNARMGDPEAQVLFPLMDGDLFDWCMHSVNGTLSFLPRLVPSKNQFGVYVVASSAGYPESPRKGDPITGPLISHDCFLAGVQQIEDASVGKTLWRTSGGRVLGALGVDSTLSAAREKAYGHLKQIEFEGMHFRTDIAK